MVALFNRLNIINHCVYNSSSSLWQWLRLKLNVAYVYVYITWILQTVGNRTSSHRSTWAPSSSSSPIITAHACTCLLGTCSEWACLLHYLGTFNHILQTPRFVILNKYMLWKKSRGAFTLKKTRASNNESPFFFFSLTSSTASIDNPAE